MKYCRECGNELADLAAICPKCGATQTDYALEQIKLQQQNEELKKQVEQKNSASIQGKGLGFLITFFVGLIGFIICLALGDDDCKKASLITFIVSIIVSIVFGIIYFLIFISLISSSYAVNY